MSHNLKGSVSQQTKITIIYLIPEISQDKTIREYYHTIEYLILNHKLHLCRVTKFHQIVISIHWLRFHGDLILNSNIPTNDQLEI
jgi:hypothetical protein